MKWKHTELFSWLPLVCCLFFFASCSDEELGKGDVEFEITDSPIDNASVDAVMVTIADVKINGESIPEFNKQTINLKAYQNGNTKMLASALQLDAKTYNSLTLVLDLDHDADGAEPGCYIRTLDNTKYKLKTTTTGIMDLAINKSWSVQPNSTTNIVIDFDLRKSITYSDNEQLYRFASDINLSNAIRLVSKSNSGTIMGTYEESVSSGANEVIVYAYKKGTFNMETETQPQGDDNLFFANAVSSSKVKSSLSGNSFILALLEAGEYELYFAKYTNNGSGKLEFGALLESETTVNGSLTSMITLQANLTTNIAVSITGLL